MKVLVDTSVWSLSLRKRKLTGKEENTVSELKELIHELRVEMIGAIRQELLSGIPDNEKYEVLRDKLRAFDDLPLTRSDFERAAEFFNQCRKRGIQGSQIDFLICAVAHNNDLSIFTTDKDFYNYEKILAIRLHKIRGEIEKETT